MPPHRRRGLSARMKLTLSYAGFLMVAGTLLLLVVWRFLLRYVPPDAPHVIRGPFFPGRDDLIRAFVPPAIWALVALLAVGLVGGWFLAGRMLAPLNRIGEAARRASRGSLTHRIAMDGRRDEFRDLADVFDAMLEQLEAHGGLLAEVRFPPADPAARDAASRRGRAEPAAPAPG